MGKGRRRARAIARAEDEATGFDLAAGASAFSRRARALLEDKLTFGATLLRAGEVDAAARVLDEVERNVSAEKAVLMEMVDGAEDGDHAGSK